MFFLPFRSSFLPQFKATLADYELTSLETGDWRRFLDMNDCIIEKMLSREPEPGARQPVGSYKGQEAGDKIQR